MSPTIVTVQHHAVLPLNQILSLIRQHGLNDAEMLKITECMVANCTIKSAAWNVLAEACAEADDELNFDEEAVMREEIENRRFILAGN